MVIIGHALELV